MTDDTGEVTYSARYTPWGDTLDASGTGGFAFGYFGGLMDAATGLLYVGDGQYYDPSTGRFLTRNAKPNQSNPYLPFDPTGAMLGPLGVLALVLGSKKKKSKFDILLFVLVFAVASGMTLTACEPIPDDGSGSSPTIPPSDTPTPGGGSGGGGNPSDPGAPNIQPTPCPTPGIGLYDSEIGKFPNLVQGITEAVAWVGQYLGPKSYGVLNGIYFVSANFGAGMVADTKNRRVEVSLELAPYAVDDTRTRAIHELGHQVDSDAGLVVFGTANAGYSESHWVNEWQRHPDNPNWWLFTGDPDNDTGGNFAGLPSNYLVVPNQEHKGRFCPHSGNGGVHPCAREDFAETFTWMVYESRGLMLHELDYKSDYNIPSNGRIALVNTAISRLP